MAEPLSLVQMSTVAPEQVKWLWPPYVPLRKMTIVEGDPGVGKSTLTLALASAVSRGAPFAGTAMPRGPTVLLSVEDGLADTIRPRLDALGADPSMVHALADPLTLDDAGMERLAASVAIVRPTLIIIDPIQSYMGAALDMYRANQVRGMLDRIKALTEIAGCATIIVRHLRKGRGGNAIYQGLGSIDFVAAVRSTVMVGREPGGGTVMAHAKCNVSPLGTSLAFTVNEGRFEWLGPTAVTADDLASEEDTDHRDARRSGETVLQELLRDGQWHKSSDLLAYAKDNGISARTVTNVRARLRVETEKRADGWYCRLPPRGP